MADIAMNNTSSRVRQLWYCEYSTKEMMKCTSSAYVAVLNSMGGLTFVLNILHLVVIRSSVSMRKSANAKGMLNIAVGDLLSGLAMLFTSNCLLSNAIIRSQSLYLCVGTIMTGTSFVPLQAAIFCFMCTERCLIISIPKINSRKTNGIFKIFIMLVWLVGLGATLGAQWRSMRAQMSGGDEFYCVYGPGGCRFSETDGGYKQALGSVFVLCISIIISLMAIGIMLTQIYRSKQVDNTNHRVSQRNIEIISMLGAQALGEIICIVLLITLNAIRRLHFQYNSLLYPYGQITVASFALMKPIACFLSSKTYRLTVVRLIRRGVSKATEPSVLSTYSSMAVPPESQQQPPGEKEFSSTPSNTKAITSVVHLEGKPIAKEDMIAVQQCHPSDADEDPVAEWVNKTHRGTSHLSSMRSSMPYSSSSIASTEGRKEQGKSTVTAVYDEEPTSDIRSINSMEKEDTLAVKSDGDHSEVSSTTEEELANVVGAVDDDDETLDIVSSTGEQGTESISEGASCDLKENPALENGDGDATKNAINDASVVVNETDEQTNL